MSQPLTLECKVKPKLNLNETDQIQIKLNEIEQTVINLSKQSAALKQDVENLKHRHKVLDKEVILNESFIQNVEKEINVLKSNTEEVAVNVENVRWKIIKTNMIKEFESERNDIMNKRKFTFQIEEESEQNEGKDVDKGMEQKDNDEVKHLKNKITELSNEISKKKNAINMTDPKLFSDIKKLEKRNAALLSRYQRQYQEGESRYRQKQSELKSLQKLLAEKNSLLDLVNEK